MTEFCEAVAYCVQLGLEGLHTSLKPEEALIYLYESMVVWSSCLSKQQLEAP